MDYGIVLLETVKRISLEVAAFLPKLVLAAVVFLVGWLIAKLIYFLVVKFCHLVRLDVVADKSGINKFLNQGGIERKTIPLFADIIYWVALIVVFFTALDVLGMNYAGEVVNEILYYVPNVLVAMVIFIVGTMVARFVKSVVVAYLMNVGIQGAKTIGTLGQYAIFFFAALLALNQLKIGGEIITSAFQIAFGAFALASALAFGLGGKEVAARYLEKISKD